MPTLRFGRKLKLPSTRAIKHALLSMMLQDHLKAEVVPGAGHAFGSASLGAAVDASAMPDSVHDGPL
jgi:hypothetical protein